MRGAIELPAVAIFTIVAGSLIVLFFVVLTQSQGERSEQDTEARSLQFLDTLLKSAATARETGNNITVVDEELLFSCDNTGTWFGYQDGVVQPLHNIIVFSPQRLGGGQLQAYTRAADVPYRALNILYLSTPENLVYRTTYSVDLFEYPFEIASGSGAPKYRTVRGDGMTPQPNTISVQHVAGTQRGEVKFYGDIDTVVYPIKELLYGAMLSRDRQTYECVFDTYLQQLKFINKIQWERARRLKSSYDPSSSCWSKYQFAAFQIIDDLPAAKDFDISDAEDFERAMRMLEFMNQDLLRGERCATVY